MELTCATSTEKASLGRWPLREVVVAAALLCPLPGCSWSRPSDQAISAQLQDRSESYATLLKMLREDPKVGAIGDGFLWETGRPFRDAAVAQLGITNERLSEYRRLFAVCGIQRFDRHEDPEVFQFLLWGSGFGGHTHHKGVSWSKDPLLSGSGRRYLLIRENWYLFDD